VLSIPSTNGFDSKQMSKISAKSKMISANQKTTVIRVCAVSIVLSIAFESLGTSLERFSALILQASSTPSSTKRMADGKQWTTENLNVKTVPSYCYEDAESNCDHYGRLYTWESARRGCQSLGNGWRLPTNDEWRQMAKHYGGLREESDDKGKVAYHALLIEGSAGFNARLSGGRSLDGQYARLEAHGFYWTATESNGANAWFYNFGKGAQALGRHSDGEKQRAFSVRCVRE
jgi:uncharacterized protein (TIGR02145 family)